MGFSIRKALHIVALIGRPVLRIFGVKDKSVASKVAEAAEAADRVLPDGGASPSSPKR